MDFRTVRLEEVASTTRNPVIPQEGVKYWHYSLPSFDTGRKPIKEDGGEILSSKLLVRKGDILCNKLNMRFRRIWRIDEELPNSICSTEFIPLQAKQINRDYLYYILISDDFTSTMTSMRFGTSGSHQRVKPEQLLSYEFKIPDESQQERIANILVAIDQKIELNNQINDYLEEQASVLFKRSFPDFKTGDKTVGDYIVPKRGKSLLTKNAVPGNVPVVAGGLTPSTYHNVANTIAPVLAISASGANAGYVSLWMRPIWSSDSSFIDRKMTESVYFWYIMLKLRQQEIFDAQTGSAQPHVYPQHIADLPTSSFTEQELIAYNDQVRPLFELIGENCRENTKLAVLRDSLLPKLMSGEIDVSNIDLMRLNNHLFEN